MMLTVTISGPKSEGRIALAELLMDACEEYNLRLLMPHRLAVPQIYAPVLAQIKPTVLFVEIEETP